MALILGVGGGVMVALLVLEDVVAAGALRSCAAELRESGSEGRGAFLLWLIVEVLGWLVVWWYCLPSVTGSLSYSVSEVKEEREAMCSLARSSSRSSVEAEGV